MIADLKPYGEYRDSGLPWLGPVPAHWEIARSKRLFVERKQYAAPDDTQLSATQAYGVIPQAEYEARSGYRVVKISMHLDKRRRVEKDDFVISMRSFEGGLERAWASGAIRSSYVVLKPTVAVHAGYFRYFFKSVPYISALRATANFIRDGQDLNFGNFAAVPLPLVPLEEQAAIARFLDWANGRLERAIRAKRKVIALLEEQRQARLFELVTGATIAGATKPTGLPWSPRMPSHWELVPNRSRLRIRKQVVGRRHGDHQLLSLTKRGVVVRDISESKGKFSSDPGSQQLVRPGDLVLCLFDVPETPRTVGLSSVPGMITGAYTVLECSDMLEARFLEAFYIAMDDRKLLSPLYSGLRNTIPKERFLGVRTPMPPPAEMAEILRSVDAERRTAEERIHAFAREIEMLGEYWARLTADVVTGHLDVRRATAVVADGLLPPAEVVEEGEANS